MEPTTTPPTPHQPPLQPAPGLQPHAISLQVGLKLQKGHMFVGQHALYFVSSSAGSVVWSAAGQALGGAVGALISMGGPSDATGQPSTVTEQAVYEAAIASGGMVFEPAKINIIKQTWLTRLIRYEGKVIGARSGFPKELRREIGIWAGARGVATKGMK